MSITPNIPRLLTALAEWCACLVYIFKYRRRFSWRQLLPILAAALLLQCVFLKGTGTLPVVWWIPCMAVAAGLMFGLILLCCDMPARSAAYCTVRAFLLAEFAASLEWQLCYYSATRHPALQGKVGIALFAAPVYAAVFLVMYWLETRRQDPNSVLTFRRWELVTPVLIGIVAFSMSNLSFVYSDTPFSSSIIFDIHNIRTLVDLAGLTTLYAYHYQRRELHAQRELDAIQSILQNQYVQYRQSRESIDVINRKYHDLKHQIAVLRAEQDPARRSAFLDGMEEEIRDYEAQNKTGNPVLDTVLTGKSLYCARHGIELTCVADGALLSSIDVMDICTIFGNLLDNAIECELRLADKSKRLIHLAVYGKKGFLVIQCENYCEEMPRFEDGLPLTTKADTGYHGYGVKSVRYTAEKYGGTMTIDARDNWFELTLLIPLKPAD